MFLNLEYESSYVARLINLRKLNFQNTLITNKLKTCHSYYKNSDTYKTGTKFKNPLAEIRNRNKEMNK